MMTDHKVFVRDQRTAWEEHKAFVREYDEQRKQDRREEKLRDEKIDARIEKLISAMMGEFVRRGRDAA